MTNPDSPPTANVARLWLERRKSEGIASTKSVLDGLNDRMAVKITNAVGTMWCAYAFACLALISLPAAIHGGTATLISWIAQTFLQLVLLSIIMVGQRVAAAASDKQAEQTYNDAEALLQISGELHDMVKINNRLTEEIHRVTTARKQANAMKSKRT